MEQLAILRNRLRARHFVGAIDVRLVDLVTVHGNNSLARHRSDMLATVLQIAEQIAGILEIEPLSYHIVQQTKALLGYHGAALLLIEGNSFLKFVDVDFAVMVARTGDGQIKPSARRALKVCSALYLFDESGDANAARERFTMRTQSADDRAILAALPIYTRAELPSLIARIQEIQALKSFDSDGNGGSRETRNAAA